MDGPRLHAIVVTYRRHDALAASLAVVARGRKTPDAIVVVDNDPSLGVPPCVVAPIAYVAAPTNLGPAGAIALGIEHIARTANDDDLVMILDDDDPPIDDDAVANGFAFAMRQPDAAGVGTSGARLDRRTGRIVRLADEELTGPVEVDYIPNGGLPMYRVAPLRDVGGPNPDLFWGFEELDLGLRLRGAGHRLVVDGEAMRAGRATTGRLGRTPSPSKRIDGAPTIRRFYTLRNNIAVLRRYGYRGAALRVGALALAKPIANLPRAPRASAAHLRMSARAFRDGWTGRLGRTAELPEKPARIGAVVPRG